MQQNSILATAINTLKLESEALLEMSNRLGADFEKVIRLLQHMKGRLVVFESMQMARYIQRP